MAIIIIKSQHKAKPYKINLLVRRRQRVINERSMTKTILMLTGFAVIFAAAIACFTPGPKTEDRTQPTPAASPSR
jgi:hypothetical protein